MEGEETQGGNTKQMSLILDAGCGGNVSAHSLTSRGFKADVNIDIRKPVVHIRNFVRASICYLPFTESVFGEAVASHILEHLGDLNELQLAVHELRRTSHTSHIFVPTWYAYGNASSEHKLVFVANRFHRFPRAAQWILSVLWLPFRNRYSHKLIMSLLKKIRQEWYFCVRKGGENRK